MSLFQLLLVLILAKPMTTYSLDNWCYDYQGRVLKCAVEDAWTGNCQDNEQSPINIVSKATKSLLTMGPLRFKNYNSKHVWPIKNNGFSVEVIILDPVEISGGGLKDNYKGVSFHLHWSNTLEKGSEHTINGKAFAMEIQIIHIKTKFRHLSEALASHDRDAVAVLGIFVEPAPEENDGLTDLIKALDKIKYRGNISRVEEFILFDLLPETEYLKYYYRYRGSLTFPNCQEKVIWTVFKFPIKAQGAQILKFFKSLSYSRAHEREMQMIDNFRSIQKLGNRVVYYSRVGGLLPHAWPILLAPVLTYLLAVFLY